MTTLREAAQMALDAMLNFPDDISDDMFESIKALRAALAQPEQGPVAWMHTTATGNVYFRKKPQDKVFNPQPVYTAPPQREWQGLTDEERKEIIRQQKDFWGPVGWELECTKAIEAKLREKNA